MNRLYVLKTPLISMMIAVMAMDMASAQEILHGEAVQQLELVQCTKKDDTTVIYDLGYFQRYDVTTAEDMLRRIPGVMVILEDTQDNQQDRGLGSSGEQILINGKRIAGKANQISTSLQRIQASSVYCVQLIRGTSSGANVQNEGVLVNLIIGDEGIESGKTAWTLTSKFNDKGAFDLEGLLSHGGQWNDMGYLISYDRDIWSRPQLGNLRWTNRSRDELYHFPDGSVQQNRLSDDDRVFGKNTFTANLDYEFGNGDTVLINGTYIQLSSTLNENIQFTAFNADGTFNRSGIDRKIFELPDKREWEVGGEYRKRIAEGDLNLIFVYHKENTPTRNFRNEIVGNVTSEINRGEELKKPSEVIVRGSYSWPMNPSMALEAGGERSLNIVEQSFTAFFDLDNNGVVDPQPTLITEIEELRDELFVIHNWTISDKLALESSIVTEASNVSNNFPIVPDQNYFFIKPRADLRYNLTPFDQIQLKIERTVEQLNLEFFIPEIDVVDNEIDAGNLGLTPQTAWEFEARYERRLANDNGTIDIRGFYYAIQDFTSKKIIGFDNDDPLNGAPISAPGSTGDAYHYGIEFKASTRLSIINLPEVVVDIGFIRQESNVTNPFTGTDRRFKRPWEFDFGFRHDVTDWKMSYGMTLTKWGGLSFIKDLNVETDLAFDPLLDFFIEKELFGGISVRLEGEGMLPSKENKNRTLFAVNNNTGTIDRSVLRTETYEETRDRRFIISFRGTF